LAHVVESGPALLGGRSALLISHKKNVFFCLQKITLKNIVFAVSED